MKKSHAKVLKWLKDGARIWSGCRARKGWVCLPDGHPDDGKRVLVSTMREMTELGLVENRFGIDNEGTEFSDNIWALPKPIGRPLIEVLET